MKPFSFVLQRPEKWKLDDLRKLKLIQHSDIVAAEIIDPRYLPDDGDEELETLAADFTKPEDDLVDFQRQPSVYQRNLFRPVFARLSEAVRSEDWSKTSKDAILAFSEIILSDSQLNNLQTTSQSKIQFHLHSYRGVLKCEGTLASNGVPPQILGVFSVVSKNDTSSLERTVSQILLQGALAYDHNVAKTNHTAFVLRMERTVLQLSIARVSPTYIESLTHGKCLDESLEVFHSETYDLCKRDRRREALRLVIGLYRYMSAGS